MKGKQYDEHYEVQVFLKSGAVATFYCKELNIVKDPVKTIEWVNYSSAVECLGFLNLDNVDAIVYREISNG